MDKCVGSHVYLCACHVSLNDAKQVWKQINYCLFYKDVLNRTNSLVPIKQCTNYWIVWFFFKPYSLISITHLQSCNHSFSLFTWRTVVTLLFGVIVYDTEHGPEQAKGVADWREKKKKNRQEPKNHFQQLDVPVTLSRSLRSIGLQPTSQYATAKSTPDWADGQWERQTKRQDRLPKRNTARHFPGDSGHSTWRPRRTPLARGTQEEAKP